MTRYTHGLAVLTTLDLAYSPNFFEAGSPTWINLKIGALATAMAGNVAFMGLAVAPETGAAWCITNDGDNHSEINGVWYTPNLITRPFALKKKSHEFTTEGHSPPNSVACDHAGVAYLDCGVYQFGVTTFADGGAAEIGGSAAGQFAMWSPPYGSVDLPRWGLGYGGCPVYRIYTMSNGTLTPVARVGAQGEPYPAGNFVRFGGSLYSYVDDPGGDTGLTLIYSGCHIPIETDGTNVLSVRAADGFLMNGASALADPASVFSAGQAFGGFVMGLSGYGEIAALSSSNGATSRFMALRSVGGTWTDKTSNWLSAVGRSEWQGFTNGALYPVAKLLYVPIPARVYFSGTRFKDS